MLAKSPPTAACVSTTRSLPVVHVRDGEVFANSKDVATFFVKRHDHVMDAVKQTIADLQEASPEKSGNAFIPATYTVDIGSGARRPFPCYEMTRDGFTLLIIGFTGKVAMALKVAYIHRFNDMERELRERPRTLPPAPSTLDPEALARTISHQVLQGLGHALLKQHSMMSEVAPDEPRQQPQASSQFSVKTRETVTVEMKAEWLSGCCGFCVEEEFQVAYRL